MKKNTKVTFHAHRHTFIRKTRFLTQSAAKRAKRGSENVKILIHTWTFFQFLKIPYRDFFLETGKFLTLKSWYPENPGTRNFFDFLNSKFSFVPILRQHILYTTQISYILTQFYTNYDSFRSPNHSHSTVFSNSRRAILIPFLESM